MKENFIKENVIKPVQKLSACMHLGHHWLSMIKKCGGVMIGHHLITEDSLISEGDSSNNLVSWYDKYHSQHRSGKISKIVILPYILQIWKTVIWLSLQWLPKICCMDISEMDQKTVSISIMQMILNTAIKWSIHTVLIIVSFAKIWWVAVIASFVMIAKTVPIVSFVQTSEEENIVSIISNSLQKNIKKKRHESHFNDIFRSCKSVSSRWLPMHLMKPYRA